MNSTYRRFLSFDTTPLYPSVDPQCRIKNSFPMIEFELSEARKMEDRSFAETSSRKDRPKDKRGDTVRCTGRQCRSCTGGAVADCVAICCCPCAVLNCLALAFVKIPFLIGKRWCLGFRRKRRKPVSVEGSDGDDIGDGDGGIDSLFEIEFEEGAIGRRTGEKLEGCGDSGGVGDSDKVWVELCEFDHLCFGRVSFSGIPLQS